MSYSEYLDDEFLKNIEKIQLDIILTNNLKDKILNGSQVSFINKRWKEINKNDNVAASSRMDIIYILTFNIAADTSLASAKRKATKLDFSIQFSVFFILYTNLVSTLALVKSTSTNIFPNLIKKGMQILGVSTASRYFGLDLQNNVNEACQMIRELDFSNDRIPVIILRGLPGSVFLFF